MEFLKSTFSIYIPLSVLIRAPAEKTPATVKKPVKPVILTKDIAVCVLRDLRDRIVKLVRKIYLQEH